MGYYDLNITQIPGQSLWVDPEKYAALDKRYNSRLKKEAKLSSEERQHPVTIAITDNGRDGDGLAITVSEHFGHGKAGDIVRIEVGNADIKVLAAALAAVVELRKAQQRA